MPETVFRGVSGWKKRLWGGIMALMSQQSDSNDFSKIDPAETSEKLDEDYGSKDVRRKLRYDSPELDISRPLYLRADDDPSDEDAA